MREHVSASTSEIMHEQHRYKPYTVTPLLNEQRQALGKQTCPVWFEVGLLSDELATPVLAALETAPGFRIGRNFYENAKVSVPIAATYEQMATTAHDTTRWDFSLITPSGFATAADEGARREIPWPDPARVFANLGRRWAHFAPDTPLPDDLDAAVARSIEIADFDVRLTSYLVKLGEPPRHGAVGNIAYRIAGATRLPDALISGVNALAHYAQYAGFGDRTAMGMGYVKLTSCRDAARQSHFPVQR
jgi:CRISPR-associated endoribonuclease Cas6